MQLDSSFSSPIKWGEATEPIELWDMALYNLFGGAASWMSNGPGTPSADSQLMLIMCSLGPQSPGDHQGYTQQCPGTAQIAASSSMLREPALPIGCTTLG